MDVEHTDLCMACGKQHESELWGAKCDCQNPEVVHLQKCSGCDAIMGQITDDDYCGPKLLYCPSCVKHARALPPNAELSGGAVAT